MAWWGRAWQERHVPPHAFPSSAGQSHVSTWTGDKAQSLPPLDGGDASPARLKPCSVVVLAHSDALQSLWSSFRGVDSEKL